MTGSYQCWTSVGCFIISTTCAIFNIHRSRAIIRDTSKTPSNPYFSSPWNVIHNQNLNERSDEDCNYFSQSFFTWLSIWRSKTIIYRLIFHNSWLHEKNLKHYASFDPDEQIWFTMFILEKYRRPLPLDLLLFTTKRDVPATHWGHKECLPLQVVQLQLNQQEKDAEGR